MSKSILRKRLLSLLMACALLLGLFPAMAPAAQAAGGYPASVVYTANARVDESVGLRGTVTMTGGGNTAVGISKGNTARVTDPINVDSVDTLTVTATPAENYTLQDVVVTAIAQITHTDGTVDAVKSVQTITAGLATGAVYTVPDFTGYVTAGDTAASRCASAPWTTTEKTATPPRDRSSL